VERRLGPNSGTLGSILRHHIRTNTRMDAEEVALATKKVEALHKGVGRA
jgi:hypothetical protein